MPSSGKSPFELSPRFPSPLEEQLLWRALFTSRLHTIHVHSSSTFHVCVIRGMFRSWGFPSALWSTSLITSSAWNGHCCNRDMKTMYPVPSPPSQPNFFKYSPRALQTDIHISWVGLDYTSKIMSFFLQKKYLSCGCIYKTRSLQG